MIIENSYFYAICIFNSILLCILYVKLKKIRSIARCWPYLLGICLIGLWIPIGFFEFAGASILVLSETKSGNNRGFHLIGSNPEYPEVKSGNYYIQNKLDKTIRVWTVSEYCGYYEDDVIIFPGETKKVRTFPRFYFEKNLKEPVHQHRAHGIINAVDFWE